jgi:hypothetical protein
MTVKKGDKRGWIPTPFQARSMLLSGWVGKNKEGLFSDEIKVVFL